MEYKRVAVALPKLQLNTENDRHGPLPSQQDCIKWMLEYLGDEIFNLAQDIAANGLSPLDNLLVLPAGDDAPGEYVMWEGNRRLTALKLLDNPDRCEDAKLAGRFRALRNGAEIPSEVICIVAPSEEDADRLMELRHQGPQQGVGTVPWTGAQKTRHQERMGKRGRYAYSQDVLDSVVGKLDDELRGQIQDPEFPLSTLDRLLKNAEVREFLGLTDEDGKPRRVLHESEMLKGLTKVLRDLANKEVRVRDVYDTERQRNYLKTFSEDETPDKTRALKDSVPVGPPANGKPATVTPPARPRSVPLSRDRKKLIPPSVRYRITDRRLNAIYRELQKLDVHEYPNAVSVTLRVFLELATELYLDNHGVAYHLYGDNLRKKVEKAIKHASDNGWLDRRAAKGIQTKINDKDSLIGADTLNASVHSNLWHPAHRDLNVTWDNIQPFFDAILDHLE
jgi:hypothetical protein